MFVGVSVIKVRYTWNLQIISCLGPLGIAVCAVPNLMIEIVSYLPQVYKENGKLESKHRDPLVLVLWVFCKLDTYTDTS